MNLTQQTNTTLRWVFAFGLVLVLIAIALVSTPSGQAFVGQAQVAAEYVYYQYLSLIFK